MQTTNANNDGALIQAPKSFLKWFFIVDGASYREKVYAWGNLRSVCKDWNRWSDKYFRVENRLFDEFVARNNLDTVALLLTRNDFNPSHDGNYPLRVASVRGHIEMIQILIDSPSIKHTLTESTIWRCIQDAGPRTAAAKFLFQLIPKERISTRHRESDDSGSDEEPTSWRHSPVRSRQIESDDDSDEDDRPSRNNYRGMGMNHMMGMQHMMSRMGGMQSYVDPIKEVEDYELKEAIRLSMLEANSEPPKQQKPIDPFFAQVEENIRLEKEKEEQLKKEKEEAKKVLAPVEGETEDERELRKALAASMNLYESSDKIRKELTDLVVEEEDFEGDDLEDEEEFDDDEEEFEEDD